MSPRLFLNICPANGANRTYLLEDELHVRLPTKAFPIFVSRCASCAGPIPEVLGTLSRLENLNLYYNKLCGTSGAVL